MRLSHICVRRLSLGHMGVRRLSKLVNDDLIKNLTLDPYPICESCIQGRMTNVSFQGVRHSVGYFLELIHSDVCSLLNHAAHDGSTCFVTFTYDKSRYGYVYLMKHKSETFNKFKIF